MTLTPEKYEQSNVGDAVSLRDALKERKELANIADVSGSSPLHVAAANGNIGNQDPSSLGSRTNGPQSRW